MTHVTVDISGAREYLERFIISSKGSVERAKIKLDRLCTMRTVVPHLFEKTHAKNDYPQLREFYLNVTMPNLTKDNHRILIGKLVSKNVTPSACLESIQHSTIILEYLNLYDYAKGYYLIYDLTDVNIMDLISNMDLADLRNCVIMVTEAYGLQIAKAYIISSSNVINALVTIIKSCVSAKLGERICVLKTAECLSEYLPKQYLSEDYGGEQKSLEHLYDELNDALSSEEHVAHMEEMRQACTNEALRSSDQFDKEYLGMPGSFKTLSFD